MSTNWGFGGGSTNNGSTGPGGITGISQGVYEESSSQRGPLGAKLEFDDGRVLNLSSTMAVFFGIQSLRQQ